MIRQQFKQILLLAVAINLVFHPLSAQEESKDENKKFVQLTFISPLGTNGFNASEITNSISINMLYGVSGGVAGFELGGLHNSTSGNMIGAQFAGLGNVTTGIVTGFQISAIAVASQAPARRIM